MSNQGGVTVAPWVHSISPRLMLLNSRSRSQPNDRREGFEIRRWNEFASPNKEEPKAVSSINIAIVSFGPLSVRPLAQEGAGPLAGHRVLPRLGASHSSCRRSVLLCLTFNLSRVLEEREGEEESVGNDAQQEAEE